MVELIPIRYRPYLQLVSETMGVYDAAGSGTSVEEPIAAFVSLATLTSPSPDPASLILLLYLFPEALGWRTYRWS